MRLTSFSRKLCGMMEKWENIIWRWRIMCKKDELYEKITENLYNKVLEEYFKEKRKNKKSFYLFECLISFEKRCKLIINLDLDKSYFAMSNYKKYKVYNNKNNIFDFLLEIVEDTGKGKYAKYSLVGKKEELAMTLNGESLYGFNKLFREYIADLCEKGKQFSFEKTWNKNYNNNDKAKEVLNDSEKPYGFEYEIDVLYGEDTINNTKANISILANMYFYLTTTIGNFMLWPKGFNPNLGGGLDIFQEKFTRILGLYEWMRLVGKEPIEDGAEEGSKSINCEREEWIKNFLSNHYLQDFIWKNKGRFEAFKFFDLDTLENLRKKLNDATKKEEKKEIKEQIKKEWNLYFYRASKAIMKRSYRILTKKEPTEEIEFTDLFADFCVKKGIESEIGELIAYLIKKEDEKIKDDKFLKIEGKEISDELEELSELKNMLAEKSIEATN